MGAVLILTPVVVSAWPVFAGAVASAAASLGYGAAKELGRSKTDQALAGAVTGVSLEVPNSQVMTDQLGLGEKLSFTREGVTITFRRDDRGKATLHVSGAGHTEEELRRFGEEMSQRVVRDYVWQQLRQGMEANQFSLIEETEDENHAIHMTVRRWEN
jgi:hypothetical protein